MSSGAIPVVEKLHVEGDRKTEALSDLHKEISGHPKLVPHFDWRARADLIFPLSWHNLCVCSRNLNACSETSLVMVLTYLSSLWCLSIPSNRAVVRPLSPREPILGPAVHSLFKLALLFKDSVLLLYAKPAFLFFYLLKYLVGKMPQV